MKKLIEKITKTKYFSEEEMISYFIRKGFIILPDWRVFNGAGGLVYPSEVFRYCDFFTEKPLYPELCYED